MGAAETTRTANGDWRPPLPPWRTTESGEPRRVGVEIELIGPSVAEVAGVLAEVLGGPVEAVSRYESNVRGDDAGPWRVELDFAYLKTKGREHADAEGPPSFVDDLSEAVVRAGAEAVVPVEVVSPPLPMPELARAQRLIRELRRFGALGTRAGLTYAFGMQFNPEVPRRDVETLLAYLRAFLCLYEWLLRESRIDLTRRLTRYMAPFPAEYVQKVVDAGYEPDLPTFLDDYLEANPTRNRALDFLPLFAELDEERLRAVVTDDRVKARPALHYRLPNCEIDDPSWGIHIAWEHWLQVEHLAADAPRLAAVCAEYAEFLEKPLGKWLGDWAGAVESWLVPVADPGSE